MGPADDRTGIIKKAGVILQKRTFKTPGPMVYLAADNIRPGFRSLAESIKERISFHPKQLKTKRRWLPFMKSWLKLKLLSTLVSIRMH